DALKARAPSQENAEQIDAATLERLVAALESKDIDAIDRLTEEISARPLDERSRQIMEHLSWQVLLAEFDEAVETAKKLLNGEAEKES
ncbi:MAG: hypothetical protein LBI59_11000, partial [Candidatus Accumulibacter sp.]|nr:hypothetical protein [Accumulibacter sp.]